MCLFGESGYEIGINRNAHNRDDNWSDLRCTYELPDGIEYFSEKAQLYLAGSCNFKVKQLEVYQVTLKQ